MKCLKVSYIPVHYIYFILTLSLSTNPNPSPSRVIRWCVPQTREVNDGVRVDNFRGVGAW